MSSKKQINKDKTGEGTISKYLLRSSRSSSTSTQVGSFSSPSLDAIDSIVDSIVDTHPLPTMAEGLQVSVEKLLKTVADMATKVERMDKKMDKIKKTVEENKEAVVKKLDKITEDINDLKDSVNYAHTNIDSCKERLEKLEKSKKEMSQKMEEKNKQIAAIKNEVKTLKKELTEEVNVQERYARSFNVRLLNIAKEDIGRNYRTSVAEILVREELVGDSVEEVVRQIENAHPLGDSRRDKVMMIARFHSRPYRNEVLFRAKKLRGGQGVRIVPDLSHMDYLLKKQAHKQMEKAYKDGLPVRFSNGKLVIAGKVVPIATNEEN